MVVPNAYEQKPRPTDGLQCYTVPHKVADVPPLDDEAPSRILGRKRPPSRPFGSGHAPGVCRRGRETWNARVRRYHALARLFRQR